MRWSGPAVIVAIAAIAGGCLLPELGDFAGTPKPSDAGLGGDVATNDASDASDAGAADARTCPDGSFCEDFDDGPLGAKWATKVEVDGILGLVDAGTSPPFALQLELVPPTKSSREAFLSKAFKIGGPAHVVCSLRIRPVVRTTGAGQDYQVLLVKEVGAAAAWQSAYVKLTPTTTNLFEDHVVADGGIVTSVKGIPTSGGGVATGVWSTIQLDVDYAKKSAVLTVVGSPSTSISITGLSPPSSPSSLELVLGEDGDSDSDPSTTWLDDLVCSFL